MFQNQCTECQCRELIFPSQISAVTNTAAGILVDYTCWCGASQTMLTGRTATDKMSRAVAA